MYHTPLGIVLQHRLLDIQEGANNIPNDPFSESFRQDVSTADLVGADNCSNCCGHMEPGISAQGGCDIRRRVYIRHMGSMLVTV